MPSDLLADNVVIPDAEQGMIEAMKPRLSTVLLVVAWLGLFTLWVLVK
jgi:hypothetical protein